jgi:chromosome segregation ATPase
MPSAFETNLVKLDKETKSLETQYGTMKGVKAKDTTYRTCVAMVYEAQKAITELKAAIQKNTKGAVDDMKKWQTNYPRIFKTFETAQADVEKTKKALTDLQDDVSQAQKTVVQLNKDIGKSAIADINAALADLKDLTTRLKTLADGVTKKIASLDELPKAPKGVFT